MPIISFQKHFVVTEKPKNSTKFNIICPAFFHILRNFSFVHTVNPDVFTDSYTVASPNFCDKSSPNLIWFLLSALMLHLVWFDFVDLF